MIKMKKRKIRIDGHRGVPEKMMKRYLNVFVMMALALLIAGCNGKSGNTASAENDEASGGGAIEFHNQLLEFRKLATEPLGKTMQTLKTSTEWIEWGASPNNKPMWNLVLIGINPYKKIAEIDLSAPSSFSNEDRRLFDEGIAQIKKETGELNAIIDSLISYYRAEDYKDDNHEKLKELEPIIESKVDTITETSFRLGERSEELASIEERKFLEQDPLGVYILAMRDLNALAEEQMDILMDDRLLREGSGTSFTDASKAAAAGKVKDLADAAEEAGKKVAAQLESARKINLATIEERRILLNDYSYFLAEAEKQQEEVRKTIRYIREWGYIGNESDMELLYDTIGDLWSAHNAFIDSVNSGD
jgi:hypothetical protein